MGGEGVRCFFTTRGESYSVVGSISGILVYYLNEDSSSVCAVINGPDRNKGPLFDGLYGTLNIFT